MAEAHPASGKRRVLCLLNWSGVEEEGMGFSNDVVGGFLIGMYKMVHPRCKHGNFASQLFLHLRIPYSLLAAPPLQT